MLAVKKAVEMKASIDLLTRNIKVNFRRKSGHPWDTGEDHVELLSTHFIDSQYHKGIKIVSIIK